MSPEIIRVCQVWAGVNTRAFLSSSVINSPNTQHYNEPFLGGGGSAHCPDSIVHQTSPCFPLSCDKVIIFDSNSLLNCHLPREQKQVIENDQLQITAQLTFQSSPLHCHHCYCVKLCVPFSVFRIFHFVHWTALWQLPVSFLWAVACNMCAVVERHRVSLQNDDRLFKMTKSQINKLFYNLNMFEISFY